MEKEKDDNIINSHIHLSDEELFMRSIENPSLYEIVVWRYNELFIKKAIGMLQNTEDAKDAVQETFVRMYVHARKFKLITGIRFKSWAYKVLVNQCLNVSKKKRREKEFRVFLDQEVQEAIKDTQAINFGEEKEISENLIMLMSKLPSILRRAVSFQFLEGKSQKKIAQIEGVSEGAIRARIYRAKKELRKLANIFFKVI